MTKPNLPLTKWLQAATPAQRERLADLAKTSLPHIQHISRGRRNVSADLAQRLAHAAESIDIGIELFQVDLCAACGRCKLLSGK